MIDKALIEHLRAEPWRIRSIERKSPDGTWVAVEAPLASRPSLARLLEEHAKMLKVLQQLYDHGYTTSADHDMVRDILTEVTGSPPAE